MNNSANSQTANSTVLTLDKELVLKTKPNYRRKVIITGASYIPKSHDLVVTVMTSDGRVGYDKSIIRPGTPNRHFVKALYWLGMKEYDYSVLLEEESFEAEMQRIVKLINAPLSRGGMKGREFKQLFFALGKENAGFHGALRKGVVYVTLLLPA
jgi:hypothetical protein